jgi:hypothetical protein
LVSCCLVFLPKGDLNKWILFFVFSCNRLPEGLTKSRSG